MPQWLVQTLLVVFAVHLLLFGRAWWRNRTLRLAVTTATFGLLVTSFSLRLAAPELAVGGVAVWWLPRVAGWVGAVASVTLWLRERRGRN